MSEFTKATKAVDEVAPLVQALVDGQPGADVQRLGKLIVDTTPIISRLFQKATETDPTKQLFGPNMIAKVHALVERWNPLNDRARELLQQRGLDLETLAATPTAEAPPRRPGASMVHAGGFTVEPPPSSVTPTVVTSTSTTLSPDERRARALAAAESRARGGSSTSEVPNRSSTVSTEARQSAAANVAWACSACTYLNAASRSRCEMCDTVRPPTSSETALATSNSTVPMEVDTQGSSSAQESPMVVRMDALMYVVHSVFLGHGYMRDESLPAQPVTSADPIPVRVRYVHETRRPITATYVPVQRHLVVYGSVEGTEGVPTRTVVQLGMGAASVQAKIDYLLVYPLTYRSCPASLPCIPMEPFFTCLACLSLPGLAAAGCTSKVMASAVFEDDVLWWRVVLNLPGSSHLQRAIDSAMGCVQQGQSLPAGACRRIVREEVQRVRIEAEEEERRRRRMLEEEEEMRRMRNPLMIQPPRRPPGFPGQFGIGGDHDLMPGGGFMPFGGGGGGLGPRHPFGGGGGGFNPFGGPFG